MGRVILIYSRVFKRLKSFWHQYLLPLYTENPSDQCLAAIYAEHGSCPQHLVSCWTKPLFSSQHYSLFTLIQSSSPGSCLEHQFLALIRGSFNHLVSRQDICARGTFQHTPHSLSWMPSHAFCAQFLAKMSGSWKQLYCLGRLLGEVCLREKVLCRQLFVWPVRWDVIRWQWRPWWKMTSKANLKYGLCTHGCRSKIFDLAVQIRSLYPYWRRTVWFPPLLGMGRHTCFLNIWKLVCFGCHFHKQNS